MAVKLDIVNMALSLINQKNISDLDEKSIPADKARLFYDEVLKRLIEKHEWSFCSRSEIFEGHPFDNDEDGDPYSNGYFYLYGLPEKGIKFGEMIKNVDGNLVNARNPNTRKPYIIEGNNIYSDRSKLFLKVVYFEEDSSYYSSAFTWALIYGLASELTKVLIDSASYREQMRMESERATLEAIAEDQRKFPAEFIQASLGEAKWRG